MSAKLLPLLFLTGLAGSLHAESWQFLLEETDYPGREFSETAFLVILQDIVDTAEATSPDTDLPAPRIYPAEGLDLQKRISIHIPELSAAQALAYAGRRAGYQVALDTNRIAIRYAPEPDARALRNLRDTLTLQQLLFVNLKEPNPDIGSDLLSYAEHLLLKTRVLRLGKSGYHRTPAEYAALLTILRSKAPAELLGSMTAEATPAGFFYIAAGLHALDRTPELPPFEEPVPVIAREGRIIVLESAPDLYRDEIQTGRLLKTIRDALHNQED